MNNAMQNPCSGIAARRLRDGFARDPSFAKADRDLIERARRDRNAFAEYCFTDQVTGVAIRQAWHHRELHRLTAQHDRLVVWFPVEHGKTTQARIALIDLLGHHPDWQFAYLSSKQKQAAKVVKAAAREIVTNDRVRAVFPNLRAQRSSFNKAVDTWGATAIRVEGCPPGVKDASLTAYGLDGEILGARLHGIIIDNILDRENTWSHLLREKTLDKLDNEVFTRILPGGFIWIFDTSWHLKDALHQIAKRPGWHSVKFDAEVGPDGGPGPLWPEKFPASRLQAIRDTSTQVSYDRQYRNKPLSDSAGAFKEAFLVSAWGRTRWCESIEDALPDADARAQAFVCTGIDLATRKGEEHDQTVLSTVLQDGPRYRLLRIKAMRAEGVGILRAMLEVQRRFHNGAGTAFFRVEDNAAQVYIVQMCQDASILKALGASPEDLQRIVVRGATTTRKVRELELGIPSLAGDFEMDRWDIPDHWETQQLRDEMLSWSPDVHTGDRLMSLWIARGGLRIVVDPIGSYVS